MLLIEPEVVNDALVAEYIHSVEAMITRVVTAIGRAGNK
jgi:hypothetical protein